LLDGLRLTDATTADAEGLRQLDALDALMRANEEASGVGATLMAAAVDLTNTRALLNAAVSAKQQYDVRFRQLASQSQAGLVDQVEQGQAAARINVYVLDMTRTDGKEPTVQVSDALTAAVSYTGLRRVAQDRIAREIAAEAQRRNVAAEQTAIGVIIAVVLLFGIVVLLGVMVSRSISRPLGRLTAAATVMADVAGAELVRVADSDDPEPAPTRLAAVEVGSTDEVGQLADALNRVQATAALMLERQVSMRRNVGVMFANIARRTQNLVGRQLSLIDDMERNERSPELLSHLYRLDHVATRLRRSADSLLVVSGTSDSGLGGTPTALYDVLRSALSEIEQYQAVKLGKVVEVAVSAGLVGDMRLLMAELLENAVAFSPPNSAVEVDAVRDGDECRITIVDHGLGMSDERLAEENRRLVERERLDVAPTTVLGLFVVGRIARRHGLRVRLERSKPAGVTAVVHIPKTLLAPAGAAVAPSPAFRSRTQLALPALPVSLEPGPRFGWFDARPAEVRRALVAAGGNGLALPADVVPAIEAARGPAMAPPRPAANAYPPAPARPAAPPSVPIPPPKPDLTDGGLIRRQPGEHVGMFDSDLPERGSNVGQAGSSTLPGWADLAEPLPAAQATQEIRNGLVRRVPGTHIAPSIRDAAPEPTASRPGRDPEAERAALEGFLAGFARGENAPAVPAVPNRPNLPERKS
jgi:signal transduction histidine kinase